MAFSLIVPQHKIKTGKLTVSSSAAPGGEFRLLLSLPHALWTVNFGQADSCDIQIGEGTDAGKLLISAPDRGGHFKPTFFKTNILIRLPRLDWMPDFKEKPFDPEHRQIKDGLLITLPEWAWNKDRQKAMRLARAQVEKEQRLEWAVE